MPRFMRDGHPRLLGAGLVDQPHELVRRRQLGKRTPRMMRLELVERVAAGCDGDGSRADRVGTLDVVRRVADDEHALDR